MKRAIKIKRIIIGMSKKPLKETIKLYKLKHKATGLYFQPSRGNGNLSLTGKVYVGRKPDVTWGHVLRIFPGTGRGASKIVQEHWGIEGARKWESRYIKTM